MNVSGNAASSSTQIGQPSSRSPSVDLASVASDDDDLPPISRLMAPTPSSGQVRSPKLEMPGAPSARAKPKVTGYLSVPGSTPGVVTDELIYNDPSPLDIENGIAAQQAGRALSTTDLKRYMDSMEARPGHVTRRRRLVRAKDLHEPRDDRDPPAASTTEDEPDTTRVEASAPPDSVASGDASDEEPDKVEAEKEEVIEKARELGCKRRRKLTTRKVLIDEDATTVMENSSLMESLPPSTAEPQETNHGSSIPADERIEQSHIELAQGPDGRPLRYRVTKELRDFWMVKGMNTSLLDHQILGVHWMLNKELGDGRPRGGLRESSWPVPGPGLICF